MSQSMRPSSKSGKSTSSSSRAPSSKSTNPDLSKTIKEEEDDDFFDDTPPQYASKVPSSSISMKSSGRIIASTTLALDGSTIRPTKLSRDSQTIAPPSSRQTIQPTILARDKSIAPPSSSRSPSSRPSQSIQPTILKRDSQTIAPSSSISKSMAPRSVAYSSKSVAPTMLYRDTKSLAASIPLDTRSFSGRSMVKSSHDFKMASKQLRINEMPEEEKKEQHEWATNLIADFGPCPEKNEYAEVPSKEGYMCSRGGHGMTHEMIAEGMGAICGIPQEHRGDWSKREGPYYQAKEKDPNGEVMYLYNKHITFPGIAVPKRYRK